MTANPPPAPPTPEFTPSAKVQTQLAELRELEQQFPTPTWDEVKADWLALYAAANAGTIHDHSGRFVAFCEGKLVGVWDDQLELRIRLARELQRHPERFAITFHG
ncbi:MAG: hypothetical protein L0241_12545 [Planctomycetia bacterium]|nr:hypothetical protein [Planctomycetia bacterium]